MELKEAKLLYVNGSLNSTTIVFDALSNGYQVVFKTQIGSEPLTAQKGHVRVFKELITAVSLVRNIGFNRMSLEF